MSGTGLDPETILAFVTTSAIIEVTPGPNMVRRALSIALICVALMFSRTTDGKPVSTPDQVRGGHLS